MLIKHRSLKIFQIGFLIGTLLMISCRDDWKSASWNGDWGIPIAKGSLDIGHLIKTNKIELNGKESLTLKYRDTLFYLDAKDVLKIRDTSITSKLKLLLSTTITPGFQIMSEAKEINYNLNDAEIVQFDLKKGFLFFEVKNTLKTNIVVYLTLPGVKKDGLEFNYRAVIPPTSADAPWVSSKLDLANYSISLKGQYLNKFNKLYYELKVYTDSAGTEVKYTPDDVIEIKTLFTDIHPSYIKGYFGAFNATYKSSEYFKEFKNYLSGSIRVKDLSLKLIMDYSVGCDSKIKLNEVIGYNDKNNTYLKLNHEIIGKTINYTRQLDNNGIPSTNHSEYEMTSENSNINEFINNLPSALNYDFTLTLNPNGNNSGGNDFMYTNKTFLAKTELSVPLNVNVNDLILKDTINLAPNYAAVQKTQSAKIYLQTKNGFPLNASLQIFYFNILTNKYELIDDDIAIPAAEEFEGDKVKSPYINQLELPISPEHTMGLLVTDKIIITAKFNSTESNKYYVFYENYKIDYKLAISANVRVK